MFHLVLYTGRREEGKMVLAAVRSRMADTSSQEMEFHLFSRPEQAADHLLSQGATAIAWDMGDQSARDIFVKAREHCRDAYLLVVANPNTSPLVFLNPAVAPSSLVLRPLRPAELDRVAREMLTSLHRMQREKGACFTITWRDGQQRIPYADIYYFEVREKKLYVRLRSEEICFSGTLEQLEGQLPEQFQRCHRGFIVNTDKIERVQLTMSMISMWDGLTVPLSRSYKKAIKGRGHET